ncbi:MAG: Rpn family recombination-promoting nuclease/putative transposase [Lachnospiraceae bacterium]|nr:Rpn family recombination-promoting nuclease/putative transposase [Lachnospiraceae bacterium]
MSNSNIQQLNLSDEFLFPAALEDPVTCRLVLECIIEEKIGELDIKVEYTKKYNSELKYIRLDVYAKDSVTKLSYNLEMQNKNEHNLPLRSRFYQAQIDIGNLKKGEDYKSLKPVYVIFICNFDPFDEELYRYTFTMQCEERKIHLNDGAKRIFLSTKGKNTQEVPKILVDFLGYLNNSTDEYVAQNTNEKLKEIHNRIKILKKDRDVEARYMHYLSVDKLVKAKDEELKNMIDELQKKDSKLQGLNAELQSLDAELQSKDAELQSLDAELQKKDTQMTETLKAMVFEVCEKFGVLPKYIAERISEEKDDNVLVSFHRIAIEAGSIEQFQEQINNL